MYHQKKEKELAPNNRPVARGQIDRLWPEGRGPDGARGSGPKRSAARIPTLQSPQHKSPVGNLSPPEVVSSLLGNLE